MEKLTAYIEPLLDKNIGTIVFIYMSKKAVIVCVLFSQFLLNIWLKTYGSCHTVLLLYVLVKD